IVFLTGLAGLLLIAFRGITDKLIPLFAVGAFLAFTLSQAGMVQHWRRNAGEGGKEKGRAGAALAINAVGVVATAIALGVILIAKFKEGAWITVLIIPALFGLFLAIKRHYAQVTEQTRCPHPLDLSDNRPPVVVVPFSGWDVQTERALRFALRLSPDVLGVHVSVTGDAPPGQNEDADQKQKQEEDELRRLWAREVEVPVRQAGLPVPKLEILPSPFRRVSRPLIEFIRKLQEQYEGRIVTVVVPELVETRAWEVLLHNHLATALKAALLLSGLRRVVVTNIPWYLQPDGRPPG
ncbi:MAG: APC family permease, partial [Armatimonadetes bacterium]|nr:APC family permease [Armatimonadota bacterium]